MSPKKNEPTRRNPNSVLTIRAMGVLFVLYMLAQIVQGYIAGGEDAPSLGLLLLAIAVLGGGAVFIGVLGWKEWKKGKAEEAEAQAARRAEAQEEEAPEEAEADALPEPEDGDAP